MFDIRARCSRLFAVGALAALVAVVQAGPVRAGGRSKNVGKNTAPKTTRPVLGSTKAKVKIVVYGDMQCPYTKRLMTQTIPALVKAYPKKVQVIWHDNPLAFHKGALPAAVAGREVFRQRGSKAFYAYLKLVFANQRKIDNANLATWAQLVGADSSKVTAALTGTSHRGWIKKDQQSARARGARGTPTSFINGRKLRGSQPIHKFKAIIDTF